MSGKQLGAEQDAGCRKEGKKLQEKLKRIQAVNLKTGRRRNR
ncbi:hypothetical protein DOT_2927 [Desulfosporosinus sp. OT]|nr:hypothetical protein DOT_2927 [Desulfosporosinus sp. OT]